MKKKVNKNTPTISKKAYNNLLENFHVLGNRANYDWLMESKTQLENGGFSTHPLDEIRDMK